MNEWKDLWKKENDHFLLKNPKCCFFRKHVQDPEVSLATAQLQLVSNNWLVLRCFFWSWDVNNFTGVYITQVLFESAHNSTTFPSYLGMNNQCRDPMKNNKDCRVGQFIILEYSASTRLLLGWYLISPNDCPLLLRTANCWACWLILGKWRCNEEE